MILENILGAIGKTPIVKLNRIGAELECDLYGKCEYLSAGGSVKDRIGKKMVEKAETEGRARRCHQIKGEIGRASCRERV